jgi:hypothetical protein
MTARHRERDPMARPALQLKLKNAFQLAHARASPPKPCKACGPPGTAKTSHAKSRCDCVGVQHTLTVLLMVESCVSYDQNIRPSLERPEVNNRPYLLGARSYGL